jgi:hypothetical protein
LHAALERWFGVSGAGRGEVRLGDARSSAPAAERTA